MTSNIENTGSEITKKNKYIQYVLLNKGFFLIVILLMVAVLWSQIKLRRINNNNEALIENYQSTIDSLNSTSMMLTSKVFTWAIRSEMIRNNNENVDQFFVALIKEPNIQKIQLIDPKTGKIILSTNRKEEGKIEPNQLIVQADDSVTLQDSASYRIACPVMGLNNRLAVVVLDVNK